MSIIGDLLDQVGGAVGDLFNDFSPAAGAVALGPLAGIAGGAGGEFIGADANQLFNAPGGFGPAAAGAGFGAGLDHAFGMGQGEANAGFSPEGGSFSDIGMLPGEVNAGQGAGVGISSSNNVMDIISQIASGRSAGMSGVPNSLQSMLQWARGTGSIPWGSFGNLSNLGTTAYGLMQSRKLQQLAQMAAANADPYGRYRGAAGAQLNDVVTGGSQAYMNTPAYQARILAAQRAMAAQGYNGSGNAAVAAANAGGAGYNEYIQNMSGLAGANASPAAAGSLALQGSALGSNLAINSLGLLAKTGQMAKDPNAPLGG